MKSPNLPAIIIQKAPASGLVRAALAISAIALLAGVRLPFSAGLRGRRAALPQAPAARFRPSRP